MRTLLTGERTVDLLFAIAACSWLPHLSCHYYRLETDSSFVVGAVEFTRSGSMAMMLVYGTLSTSNLCALVYPQVRFASLLITGSLHSVLGLLHLYRLIYPFTFIVFGYAWTSASSLREAIMALLFGVLCVCIALTKRKTLATAANR
jgi:hypothetical protein